MSSRVLLSGLAALVLTAIATAQSPLQKVDGLNAPGWFRELRTGAAIDGVGDMDGDGHDDYVVGIPGFQFESGNIEPWGAAKVLSGRTGLYLHWVYGAPLDYDEFGHAVAGIGDVTGDGIPDFAVGAPESNANGNDSGRLYLYSGDDGSLIRQYTGLAGQQLGYRVKGVGDMNGDGRPDLLVSAPAMSSGGVGEVRLLSGSGATLHTWTLSNQHDFGLSFGVGDFNGDSTPDVYIGSPARDRVRGVGYVVIYDGISNAIIGLSIGSPRYGETLAMLGDLDQDGVDDYAVGAPAAPNPSGIATGLVSVRSAAQNVERFVVYGSRANSFYAEALASIGDQDGDGRRDLIVGERHHNSGGGMRVGRAVVYSSSTGDDLYHTYGPSAECWFGFAVGDVGDIDADGRPDFAAGAPYDGVGSVQVFGSADLRLDFFPGFVAIGDSFQMRIRGGRPGAPYRLFLYSVDGISYVRPLLSGVLNAAGEASRTFVSGTDDDLQISLFVLSQNKNGQGLQLSNFEVLHTED